MTAFLAFAAFVILATVALACAARAHNRHLDRRWRLYRRLYYPRMSNEQALAVHRGAY